MLTSLVNLPVLVIIIVVFYEVTYSQEEQEWEEHLARVKDFPCGVPQPRSFRARDLLRRHVVENKKIYPSSTVLYRCESAGCCDDDKGCFPSRTKEVVLTFGFIENGETDFISIKEVDHVACSCEKLSDKPKRK